MLQTTVHASHFTSPFAEIAGSAQRVEIFDNESKWGSRHVRYVLVGALDCGLNHRFRLRSGYHAAEHKNGHNAGSEHDQAIDRGRDRSEEHTSELQSRG